MKVIVAEAIGAIVFVERGDKLFKFSLFHFRLMVLLIPVLSYKGLVLRVHRDRI